MLLRKAVERLRSGNRMNQYFPFSPVKVGVDGSFFENFFFDEAHACSVPDVPILPVGWEM